MISPVVREVAVDWASLVKDALEEVQLSVPRSVEDSLMALNTYAKLPLSAFAQRTTGLRDARVYCALLTSLDQAITEWPPALQRKVYASQVQRGGSKITTCRPLVEATITLYNAAVENMEAGLSDLSQARADVVQHRAQGSKTSTAVTTRAVMHPSLNAKNAYRHFQCAHVLCADVAGLLFPSPEGDSGAVAVTQPSLSVYEAVQLKSLLELEELQTLVSLCSTVAKYIFALTDSVGEKSDVLAKLAFAGASLHMPEKLGAAGFPEIRLLPSVLLTAYHCHQAEYYYKIDPKVPDMTRAIGHISYADELLCEIEKQLKSGSFQKVDLQGGSKVAKMTLSLGKLLWRKFVGDCDKKETDPAEMKYIVESETDKGTTHRVSVYNSLLRFLSEGESSLVRVFPVVDNLVRHVYELYKQYQYENMVIYLMKPLPVKAVQLDIPDSAVVELSLKVPGIEGSRVAPLVSFLHRNTFKDMPQGPVVEAAYSKKEERKTHEVDMLNQCTAIESIVNELRALQLPHEARLCIEALEPCLEENIGSIAKALKIAETTLQDTWKEHEAAAKLWMSARAKYLGTKREVGFHGKTLEVQREVEEWCKSLETAESTWLRCIGPLDFGADIEELILLLLPKDCRGTREYVQLAESTIANTRKTLQRAATFNTDARRSTTLERSSLQREPMGNTLESLKRLTAQGEQLLERLREVMEQSDWWESRQAAMRQVVLVIWGAPELKNKLTLATQLLQEECIGMNNMPSLSPPPSVIGRSTDSGDAAKGNMSGDSAAGKRPRRASLTHDEDNSSNYESFADKKRPRGEKTPTPNIPVGVFPSVGGQSTTKILNTNNTTESSEPQAEVSSSLRAKLKRNREAIENVKDVPSKKKQTNTKRK